MGNFDDNDDTAGDKTSIIQSDTFRGRLEEASKTPPCLVMLVGPHGYVGRQWFLTESEVVIGRAVESFIFVDDPSLSRAHAKLAVGSGDVSILDLDSTNKTVINGKPLPPLTPYTLSQNDQIKTGNVIFKYHEEGSLEAVSNQNVYDRAQRDALTGIYSKGALMNKGPEAMKRSEVLTEPLSMIVFDIDKFKPINDNYGHPAGDFILQELAKVVGEKLVRDQDFFARFGGEEFVVLLAGSPLQQALDVAERIRATVEAQSFIFEGIHIPVTVSLGVAERRPNHKSWQEVFQLADSACYNSKNNGRNRVSSS